MTSIQRIIETLLHDSVSIKIILDSLPLGIVLIDAQTHKIIEANTVALQLLETNRDHLIGSLCHQYLCPEEHGKCPITDFGLQINRAEQYLITAEDRVKQVEKSVVSLTIQDQKYMLETFIDITQHKQDEDILKRYNLILENALDPILFIRCKDGKIIEANRTVIKTYGYDREEILSMSIFDLRDDDTKFRIENQMAKADNQGILFETVHRKKDGTTFPVEVSSSGTDLGGERVLVSIIRDISERQEHEAQLTYMANHDHLTGLPNRRLLEHSLTRAISRGRRGKKVP